MTPLVLFAILGSLQQAPSEPPVTPVDDIDVIVVRDALVTLECNVERRGTVRDCVIISEDPPGQGFGEAALNAALRARLSPRSIEGRNIGGKVRFTTRFRLDS